MILADIMSGEVDTADVAFLVAVILAVVAGVLYLAQRPNTPPAAAALLAFAVGAVAFGLMAL